METAVLDAIKQQTSEIKGVLTDWEKAKIQPLREELVGIAGQYTLINQQLKDARRADLMRSDSHQRGRILDGKYAGFDSFDLHLARALMNSMHERRDITDTQLRAKTDDWKKSIERAAAMDSTTAATGDELVPTLEATNLWMDVNLATRVASLFTRIPMPSAPFDLPVQLGDLNWYPATQNAALSSTALSTAKRTLNAYELGGVVPWSYDLEEDAVISMMPSVRSQIVMNAHEVIDDVVLNADTTVTNGINSDGATITTTDVAKAHWLLGFDGLRHYALVDQTGQANNHSAAVSDAMWNTTRLKTRKYGINPSDVAFITDINTFIKSQTITTMRTLDVFGPNATILSGQLGSVEGIPVIVSEQMRLADTDGKVTDAGNATDTGSLMLVNRSQWNVGFKREISIETVRDALKRQHQMVITFRIGLLARGVAATDRHTALSYNITGVT